MKINYKAICDKEIIEYSPNLELLNEINNSRFIKDFKDIKGLIFLENVNDILIINFNLNVLLEVYSTISFEPFDYKLKIKEELYLTKDKEKENDEIIYFKDGFELDEIIYSLIITSLPLNLVKEGDVYYSSNDFKVYSEDELFEELNNEDNNESPFDILKDIDFDDNK